MAAKVNDMKLSKIYGLLVAKAERKSRSKEEVDKIIGWLTGYKGKRLAQVTASDMSYEEFFAKAPNMNPNRELIKGKICGVQVETIEDPFMKKVRQLDKMIDELARGKSMDKILRVPVDIDEFISLQEQEIQPLMTEVRRAIAEVLPQAEERMSWGMPTWWDKHNIIHMAPARKHLGIYPGADGVEHFADRLDEMGYKYSKGAIQFPYKDEIPIDFICEIAAWCGENNR